MSNTVSIIITVLLSVFCVLFACDLVFALFFLQKRRKSQGIFRKQKVLPKPVWTFVYDEEDGQNGTFLGIISNGESFLFTKTKEIEGAVWLQVYSSILLTVDTLEVQFRYSEENIRILLDALNSGKPFFGENSVLSSLPFEGKEKPTYYYQPKIKVKEEDAEYVLPKELFSFDVFASYEDAKSWLYKKGYTDFFIVRYEAEQIEKPRVLDCHGKPI